MKALALALCLLLASCAPQVYRFEPVLDGQKSDCVERALRLVDELRREGKKAYVILGVLKDRKGRIAAGHAWVKWREPGEETWRVIKNY